MSIELSKYQGFQTTRVARSQLTDAPYNPRKISAGNRERLSRFLKKHKLVVPPTWNKRTGNLVAGHQRLSILDDLHQGADYLLDVAVIDVSEKEEVELNIGLNNDSAMGEFDFQALKDLSTEYSFDLGDVGFSLEDCYLQFGMEKPFAPEKSDEAKQAIKERRNEEKAEYREQKLQGLTNDSEAKQDYIISIVFPTNRAAVEWLQAHGLDASKRMFPIDRIQDVFGA